MAESEAGTGGGDGAGGSAEADADADVDREPDAEPEPDPRKGDTDVDGDGGEGEGEDGGWEFSDRGKLGALIAVVGIVGTGVVDFALSQLGAPGVGGAVWAAGYGLTIVALWYVLLRPLDLG
jgi:hypothetical protein